MTGDKNGTRNKNNFEEVYCLSLETKLIFTVPGLGTGMSLVYPLKDEFSKMSSIAAIE